MAASAVHVCFSINNRSLITPPTIACTRSKLSYFSVMIWAWALSLHKYEYEYEYEYGYREVDCYERSLCLFLRVWAGEWLTSYTCTDPGLMLAPKHCRWGHCYCGQTRYYDVCWIQGFSRYWQAGSPSPDINKQSEFATSKICQILARKLIYSLSILVTSHESQQVNASRYILYSILTVNYLH